MSEAKAVVKSGRLSQGQLASMRRDGFLSIDRLIGQATLDELRGHYDRVVSRELDCGEDDRQLGGVTRQVMHPRKYIPYFQDNPATEAALAIAEEILDGDTEMFVTFDMLIYKPPGHPKSTPWHVDFSYTQQPFAPAGIPVENNSLQFWVPLDDVDVENGCMHFVPGVYQRPLVEHFIYSGDVSYPGRLLATRAFGDPDLPNEGIACPLPAGGCTIHFLGAPHYTPPNRSATRGRRAYIFNVARR